MSLEWKTLMLITDNFLTVAYLALITLYPVEITYDEYGDTVINFMGVALVASILWFAIHGMVAFTISRNA